VRTAQAIINLALMTGNIGRPGTGANSITGQCNAMGSRLFSNTTNLLGGHDFANEQHRNKVAAALGISPSLIPTHAGWAYNQIIEGILREKIKGLWVIGTNPAHSWINQNQCHDVLGRLDFLVVQDMYRTTETAQRADMLLPAAGWGEKEGTFINSERRIGVIKKVARPPGTALPDFAIFRLIAHYWGCGEMFSEWDSPEAVFKIIKRLSQGQPCDMTGISGYRMIDEHGGIQWPFPRDERHREVQSRDNGERHDTDGRGKSTERRLFEDGRFYHADGRARFLFEDPRPLPELPTANFPLVLLTGRGSVSQWHTQTRTAKSDVLRKLYPERIFVELNPADAQPLGIVHDDWVFVESQRGRVRARAFLTHAVKPGMVFIPMHYDATNQLTHAAFDPYSKQPAYKACAVRVERAVH
jgi:assimilatory nitrate reductase catalytic subunit